jgi:hypothetical protein
MPTTREHSSCLEASRATALAAHSTAGLAAAAGLREAARLLRSCEALARAATAALQSCPTSASPVRPGAAPADVPAAPAALAAGRQKKKKKKKKAGINSENMVVDGNAAGGVPAAGLAPAAVATQMSPHAPTFAPGAAAASARELEKKPSRERSPRRDASPMPPSSSLPSPSSAISLALGVGVDGFSVGQAAVLTGLVSRPELSGCLVTLRSFDAASSRWAASLDTTGESIRVKTDNLRPSIFKPGAPAAGAHG